MKYRQLQKHRRKKMSISSSSTSSTSTRMSSTSPSSSSTRTRTTTPSSPSSSSSQFFLRLICLAVIGHVVTGFASVSFRHGYISRSTLLAGGGDTASTSASSTSSTVPTTTTKIHITKEKIEDMTVKELRQLIKDNGLHQRGTLSQLRLKQDLVSFVKEKLENSTTNSTTTFVPVQPAVSATEGIDSDMQLPTSSSHVNMNTTEEIRESDAESESSPEEPVATPPPPRRIRSPVPGTGMPGMTDIRDDDGIRLSPRDIFYQEVSAQYPGLKTLVTSDDQEDDIRQQCHPIFSQSKPSSDLDIVFVGTASCSPSTTRGVSCTALRLNWKRREFVGVPENAGGVSGNVKQGSFEGGTWLFDCGECTQLQLQRTGAIRPGKVTKIFVTHAHGDHSFGLPGLMCLLGDSRPKNSPPIDVYGPEGLRMWLRIAIRYSVSRIVPKYRVHELKDVPMAPEWRYSHRAKKFSYGGFKRVEGTPEEWSRMVRMGHGAQSWTGVADSVNLRPSLSFGELDNGRDIYPIYGHECSSHGAPVWEVEDEGDVKVYAAPMSHGIPCVGYVVDEQPRAGRLRDEYVRPIVERNMEALREAGFKFPLKAMAVVKSLPVGASFTFPDGTVVTRDDAVEPERKGRKVVICGDTANSRAMEGLARDADVVIHEATNCYLKGIDQRTDERTVTHEAVTHGHSTPTLAGKFARQVNAKKLILNHFSARYKGDASIESVGIMTRIEQQAAKASGLNRTDVAAAWDFMEYPV